MSRHTPRERTQRRRVRTALPLATLGFKSWATANRCMIRAQNAYTPCCAELRVPALRIEYSVRRFQLLQTLFRVRNGAGNTEIVGLALKH